MPVTRLRPLADLDRSIIAKEYAPRSSRASFPVPAAQSQESPTYCLRVNVHWVGHVIGLLMALDQQDAWAGSGGDIEFARNEARKLIASLDVCGDDMIDMGELENCVMPVGTVMAWAGASIPEGWLECDGAQYTNQYLDLYSVLDPSLKTLVLIGDDLFARFWTPDLRSRAPIGRAASDPGSGRTAKAFNASGGAETHTLTIAEMPAHSHQQTRHGVTPNTPLNFPAGASVTPNQIATGMPRTLDEGGGGAHNNMPPYLTLRYIIKAVECEPQTGVALSYKLRQNPENSCLLEQSLDGGTTWIPAFDYDACFGEMKDQIDHIEDLVETIHDLVEDIEAGQGDQNTYIYNSTNTQVSNYIQYLNNTYNDNVYNIYPQAEYDSSPDDVVRNDTLCVAIDVLGIWVKQMIAQAIENGDFDEGGFNPLKFISDAASVIATGAGLGAVYTWWTGAGLAIAAAVGAVAGAVNVGAGWLDSVTDFVIGGGTSEDIENYDLSDFICCLYDAMKDTTISQALFISSFETCTADMVEESGAGEVLGKALLGIGSSLNAFLTFLDILSNTFEGVNQGYLSADCNCDHCEEFLLNTNPDPAPTESTSFATTEGVDYQVTITGIFPVSDSNEHRRCDAFYDNNSTASSATDWDDMINYNGLTINGTNAVTLLGGRPAFEASHVYVFTLEGTGSPFSFRAQQGEGDGGGSSGLTIEVCEVE